MSKSSLSDGVFFVDISLSSRKYSKEIDEWIKKNKDKLIVYASYKNQKELSDYNLVGGNTKVMNILISDGSDRYVTIVECPKEISENFYVYLNDFINSTQYKHNWGAEELIRYINKTKPSNLKDLKIIDLYTDKYDKDSPRFNI